MVKVVDEELLLCNDSTIISTTEADFILLRPSHFDWAQDMDDVDADTCDDSQKRTIFNGQTETAAKAREDKVRQELEDREAELAALKTQLEVASRTKKGHDAQELHPNKLQAEASTQESVENAPPATTTDGTMNTEKKSSTTSTKQKKRPGSKQKKTSRKKSKRSEIFDVESF
ncbi:hypothetical protein EAF00_000877 [Botryotinia globosa]|nr:hypothetical protein EAF00_000877 [Botryotinia globosa]